jgi:UDP-glucose 4-epimerase
MSRQFEQAVVTGAAGFIGQALVRHLAALGEDVLAIDRHPCALPESAVPPSVLTADLSEPGVLGDVVREGATIFHLAASADVAASVRDPRNDLTNTFAPLFEVLETARRRACRVVFPSTASVFDTSQPLPLAESAAKRPTSPYGAAKLAGEAYCIAYFRSYGTDTRIARLFSVYGPGMRRLAIHDLIAKVRRNPHEIELLGDGTQVRDYLYVDDAVRGLVTVAARGDAGQDYNVASGEPVGLLDLARLIATGMGHAGIRIVPTGRSFPGDTPRWYGDVSKIRALGFAPEVPLRDGLARTIAALVPQLA